MWNPFDHMKAKYKKNALYSMHFFELLNYYLSRIELEGFPENIKNTDTLTYLLTNGTVGCAKFKDGNYWTFPGSYCGEFYGPIVPKEYMGTLPVVGQVRGEAGKKIAVGWNNATRTPEFNIIHTASVLSEIDVSEACNVMFARDMRIPKVHDQAEKEAILTSLRNIRMGNVDAIVSSNVHAEELINGVQADPFLDLTDVQQIDKLQYLDQYRKAVMRRFFELLGQKTTAGPKMAQMSKDEVNGNDSISVIMVMEHLDFVKQFCEECNKLFGWNTSAKLTESFQDELEEMKQTDDTSGEPQEEEGGSDDGNTEEN